MNPTVVEKHKAPTFAATRKLVINADASGNPPTRLQLMAAGLWTDSWKGNIEITITDLLEMKANFDAGVGLPGNGTAGAPIDYSHEDYSKAAGWIKEVEVENGILYASVIEWTPAGAQAIKDGEFKFFSPSFYPACLGQWYDPEDPKVTARNVLLGGGLTNIPFFKKLTGLNASQTLQRGDEDNQLYITASNKGESMELANVLAKDPTTVTVEEKSFLTEHKAELTADQQVAFGIENSAQTEKTTVTPTNNEEDTTDVTKPEDAAVLASIKDGKAVLVNAAEHAQLQSTVSDLQTQVKASADIIASYEKEKVEASVKAHIARGAIKADQADAWTQKILADRSMEDMLKNLPDNKILANELGSSESTTVAATDQFEKKVQDIITASNGTTNYSDAVIQAARENSDLAKAHEQATVNQ